MPVQQPLYDQAVDGGSLILQSRFLAVSSNGLEFFAAWLAAQDLPLVCHEALSGLVKSGVGLVVGFSKFF